MAEQSLRERIHPTASTSAADHRGTRIKLLLGAVVGLAAAAYLGTTQGYAWAVPGLIIAAACAWGFFARASRG